MFHTMCIPGIHSYMHAYRIARGGNAIGVRARQRGGSTGGAAAGGAKRRTDPRPSRVP
jgi:hypothetical protein